MKTYPAGSVILLRKLLLAWLLLAPWVSHAGDTVVTPHRVYSHPLMPKEHPDYARRAVKPPDWDTFGGRPQFTTLRGFGVENDTIVGFREELEKYTRTHQLGDVIWPSYPILFAKNLGELAEEIRRRNLYLFDIWGYVPGSGPGGYWQQFKPPATAFALLEEKLGERWLGTDIGEQDGRYIGGYASQMTPASANRFEQYLNFQRHFERMGDDLGHKHATLVSLNFGHYFLKEGTYTLIGAETAQALPNNQVYYAFIRGAGKQYGVPWFGNASIFNRWGFKTYGSSGRSDGYEHGPTKGSSLSLLKRLLYSHLLYNCVAVGFENGWFDGDKLSPIGRIQQAAQRWILEHGQPGHLQAPVAVLLNFDSGWSFPRHLYSGDLYRVWGNLPYTEVDYFTDAVLDLIYPSYQDSSFYHDEAGFIAPTPYGDIADCLLSDAPAWLLERYAVVIAAADLKSERETRDKLIAYVRAGGHLVLTAANLAALKEDLQRNPGLASDSRAPFGIAYGRGRLTVLGGDWGIETLAGASPLRSEVDRPLAKPYRWNDTARQTLSQVLSEQRLFDVHNPNLSLITCRKDKGDYTLGIINNTWREEPFRIDSLCGRVESVRELPLDVSEKTAEGYTPEGIDRGGLGNGSADRIAGGDVRIFAVRVEEAGVEEIPHAAPPPRPINRLLPLRHLAGSLKEAVLARPTFFEHFDGVILDWRYVADRERTALEREAGWIRRQGLRVWVDVSSGINLYPTLRVIDNVADDYAASLAVVKDLQSKMATLGAQDLIVSLHRHPENNFTDEQTRDAFAKTLRQIAQQAEERHQQVHLRLAFGKPPWNPAEAAKLLDRVDAPNLRLAVSTALLADNAPGADLEKTWGGKVGLWLAAAAQRDLSGRLWDAHAPLSSATNQPNLRAWLQRLPDVPVGLDAVYADVDREYLDAMALARMRAATSASN